MESLAKLLGTSTSRVVKFFDGADKVQKGVYYDVTNLTAELDQERRELLDKLKEFRFEVPLPQDRVDPTSPWKSHYPGFGGMLPRNPSGSERQDELFSPNKLAKGTTDQRKPGKLGQFKGADSLRAENRVVRDVAKKLRLTKTEQQQLHRDISGEGLSYQEILERARNLFGKN